MGYESFGATESVPEGLRSVLESDKGRGRDRFMRWCEVKDAGWVLRY